MRRLAALFCIAMGSGLALGGSGAPAFAVDVPVPRPKPPIPAVATPWREPLSFREAAGADFQSATVTSQPFECRVRLEKMANLHALPRLMGPGACGGGDMVELAAVLLDKGRRIDIKPAPVLRCEMAEQFALWLRDDVMTRLAKGGLTLASVETYDDYSCRGRNRVFGAKLSEHGKGNAVDVRSLTFADRKVSLLTDKTFAKDIRDDLRLSSCARFTTVLGPGSDSYHEEHIHLDLAQRRGGFRMCQWNVLEPPPPPPKPAAPKVEPPSEAKSEARLDPKPDAPAPEAIPQEADDDTADAAADAGKAAPAQIALADVPLPRPRPPANRRKSRSGVHFPFNLLR